MFYHVLDFERHIRLIFKFSSVVDNSKNCLGNIRFIGKSGPWNWLLFILFCNSSYLSLKFCS
jgi:hypothetical protein